MKLKVTELEATADELKANRRLVDALTDVVDAIVRTRSGSTPGVYCTDSEEEESEEEE